MKHRGGRCACPACVVTGEMSAATVPGMTLDDNTARELSRAAANVRTWTTKRNELIRSAHAGGAGVREIERATGLNVATVSNIIRPRKRGAT